MLHITVPKVELFNEATSEFIYIPETTFTLEHSLVSLSKWESKWKKPFLGDSGTLSNDELVDYVKCMTISPKNADPVLYTSLLYHPEILEKVSDYINDSMTATWFSDDARKKSPFHKNKTIVTSEVIYYWMCKLNIPVEFEKWHLNRLMTLIEVFNANDAPPKKRSKAEMMAARRAENERRKKMLGTRG